MVEPPDVARVTAVRFRAIATMNADELRILADASKLLARTEYRRDAARLNAIITMEGGDSLVLCKGNPDG